LFQVFAGVDLFRGRVARLVRGRAEEAFYYPGSAEEYARRWVEEGADWLHVIDLDAALGVGDNFQTISTLMRCVKAPAQVGGGVRSLEKAYSLVDAGAARVIVSQHVLQRPGEGIGARRDPWS
jgi:phosphoribosylformimino-5-aminoimidazole carboxamide ribotide isomerase